MAAPILNKVSSFLPHILLGTYLIIFSHLQLILQIEPHGGMKTYLLL